MEPRAFLRALFDAAVEAAMPGPTWFAGLKPPKGRTVVVDAGKAASMARALEAAWPHPVEGLVVSNVPDDDPATVASGPTLSDDIPPVEALRVAERYGLDRRATVRERRRTLDGSSKAAIQNPKSKTLAFASARIAFAAAAKDHALGVIQKP